jgi:hypothetical protein
MTAPTNPDATDTSTTDTSTTDGPPLSEEQRLGMRVVRLETELRQTQRTLAARDGELARAEQLAVEMRLARDEASGALAAFKEQVREVAIRLAEKHDWCPVVDDALISMGLQPRSRDYQVEVTVTGTFRVTVNATDEDNAVDTALDEFGLRNGNTVRVNGRSVRLTEVTGEVD